MFFDMLYISFYHTIRKGWYLVPKAGRVSDQDKGERKLLISLLALQWYLIYHHIHKIQLALPHSIPIAESGARMSLS